MDILQTKTYYYDLPDELIAQTPVEPRDSSRLLVYHKETKSIEHKIFRDVIDYLNAGDVLVINNTKVIPARLYGEKKETGAHIETLLLKRLELDTWEVLMKPAKRAKIGAIITYSDNLIGEVIADTQTAGGKIIKFSYKGVFEDELNKIGSMPLPPYIHAKLQDNKRYNTVFAKTPGSSAAPTAGLHFTTELLEKIKQKGVIVAEVQLNVGLGTFRPVSEDNILNHEMHTEWIEVTPETAKIINDAKAKGGRVIACGTTSIRTLESVALDDGTVVPQSKDTSIFIYPGFKFKVVDGVITNFHLPESTLIMLVSAFCGVEETLNMYNIAVSEKYRFFSFGDATLLLND